MLIINFAIQYDLFKKGTLCFILYRLTPEDIKEDVIVPLKFVKFQNVSSLTVSKVPCIVSAGTVKPVLGGHRIMRTLSIKRTVAEVPKLTVFPFFSSNETFIKRTPLLRGRGHPKSTKWSFLLLPTSIKRTLVIKFHHPTCQTLEMRKIASHNFFDFCIKKRGLTNLFD